MKIYFANIYPWHFPRRGQELIVRQGHQLGGNWLGTPYYQRLEEFSPDVIFYAPARGSASLTLPPEVVKKTPTILWALYPDYLTGWDREKNEHMGGFLESVRAMMPYFRAYLANSRFTKGLLEARVPGYIFEVCYLGIDTSGIDEAAPRRQLAGQATSVAWMHRWASDKNLSEALGIVLHLARRHPKITFYVGSKEDWNDSGSEPFWATQSLKDSYLAVADELNDLSNIQYRARFKIQRDFWAFLHCVDIAFSCAANESFGIAMLEHAYAGDACVVPDRVAYSEVHAGALVVPASEVEAGIELLINNPALWAQVAESSRVNAARYDVASTVGHLLSFTKLGGGLHSAGEAATAVAPQ
ncbi:MAG: glycosyltransferase [Anaerolineae bacterium]